MRYPILDTCFTHQTSLQTRSDRQVEVHTQPSGPTATPAYGQHHVYGPGQSVPLVLGGVAVGSIAVDDLLP